MKRGQKLLVHISYFRSRKNYSLAPLLLWLTFSRKEGLFCKFTHSLRKHGANASLIHSIHADAFLDHSNMGNQGKKGMLESRFTSGRKVVWKGRGPNQGGFLDHWTILWEFVDSWTILWGYPSAPTSL